MSKTFSSRLASTAGHLLLAFLNATLVLVVLALLLAWALAGRVDHVAQTAIAAASAQIAELSPLADAVGALNDELAGVRDELANLRHLDGSGLAETRQAALAKVDALETSLTDMRAKLAPAVEAVSRDPSVLIDSAVRAGVMAAGQWLASLGDCKIEDGNAARE